MKRNGLAFILPFLFPAAILMGCGDGSGTHAPIERASSDGAESATKALAFSFEDQSNGTGETLSMVSLKFNQTLSVWATLRDDTGAFTANPSVDWIINTYSGQFVKSFVAQPSVEVSDLAKGLYKLNVQIGDETHTLLFSITENNVDPMPGEITVGVWDAPTGGSQLSTIEIEEESPLPDLFGLIYNSNSGATSNVVSDWEKKFFYGSITPQDSGKKLTGFVTGPSVGTIKVTYGDLTSTISVTVKKAVISEPGLWKNIVALGPKMNQDGQYVKPDGSVTVVLSESDQKIELEWADFPSVEEESYAVFKSISSGGFDWGNPIFESSDAATKIFVDTDLVPGTFYYYTVIPKVSGSLDFANGFIQEVRVLAPKENLALVHRWIANQQVCKLLSKHSARAMDKDNHYRCPYTGAGSVGGYFDFGKDFVIERFESGCRLGQDGVSYDSGGGRCYKNGIQIGSLAGVDLQNTVGSFPGLPPAAFISQPKAQEACNGRSITVDDNGSISSIQFRLPRMKEWRVAAAWSDKLTDNEKMTREGGVNSHNCNTSTGNKNSWLSHPDGQGVIYGIFKTGTYEGTKKCVSNFGAQDMIGNVSEWASDQCQWESSGDGLCLQPSSPLDSEATDLYGWIGMGLGGYNITNNDYFNPVVGMAAVNDSLGSRDINYYQTIINGDQSFKSYGTRGAILGGHFMNRNYAGRWFTRFDFSPWSGTKSIGFRCVADVPY